MAEAWTVNHTANGINVLDENGLPVCTRVGLDDANLIASAPRLAEQARILREALTSIRNGSGPLGRWIDSENYTAIEEEGNEGTDQEEVPENPNSIWEPYTEEEQRLWLDSVVIIADTALEATKEGVQHGNGAVMVRGSHPHTEPERDAKGERASRPLALRLDSRHEPGDEG